MPRLFRLTIALGNDAMLTAEDVSGALADLGRMGL
jgi:hypothetical protein